MAVKKKTPAKTKKTAAAKKAAAPKKAVKAAAPKKEAVDTTNLDRKALAAHARQAKKELLAIRFNLQAPSLKEYRRKKSELQKLLSQLN